MKRLTETWKQQKQRNQLIKTLPSQNAGHGSGKKRLGQHAVSRISSDASASKEPTRNNAHCGSSDLLNSTALPKRTSQRLRSKDADDLSSPSSRRLSTESSRTSNISFASDFEIDDDILKHVEQLEADFEQQNVHAKSPNNLDKDNNSAINLEENEENGNNPGPRNQDSGTNIEYKDNKNFNDIIQVVGQNKKCTNSIEDQRESAIRFDRTKAFSFVQSFASGKNEFDKEENATGEVLCQDSQSPESKESHPNHDGCNVKLNCQHDNLDGIKKQPLEFDTSPLPLNGQRSPISPPPTSTQECLSLSSWGLPEAVLNQYYLMGVQNMFPWQVQCLRKGKVLQGGNLIYSAPTSAGKTLVAELLVLKKVLESKKKAIIILPFVSVSREKMFYLQTLLQDTNVRVDGFMGSHSPPGGLKSVDVAVCTIEKANSLINRLLEENKLDQLGIIVVDELHMVGDSHRGYLLELLLTKVKYVTSAETNRTSIQIVGMSATLPNLDLLAKWLDADLYSTDFRPVPLTEFVKIGPSLYDSQMNHAKNFDLKYDVQNDEDHIFSLSLETMAMGCGVLIFCPTKNWCEKLAENMARELSRLRGVIPIKSSGFVKASEFLTLKINHEALQDVLEQLKGTPAGLDSTLKKTVPCAVAYHHAGLTFDERDIVEGGFRQGHIRILIATSTLSSGVNLPARRVIIRTIMFNRRVIDPLCYRQMAGRAGRKGVDTEGESILVCKPNEMEKAKALISSDLPPVQSCLIQREGDELSNSMKRAILEVIASGVAKSPTDVQRYSSSTLLAASLSSEDGDNPDGKATSSSSIDACISFLREQEFIRLENGEDGGETFLPTQLGSATLASALSPHEALAVFTELQRARKSFVLENELHILYQVTPIYDNIKPDWYQFLCFWETLSTDKRRVAELVGVEERFLIRAAKGNIPTHTARQQHLLSVHRRFHTALILEELVNEAPLNQVARKYGCSKGQLQSLQQSASTFAGMVTVFCSKLGWYNLELLLAQFQNRLNFGVQRELVDLVRISLLNAQRARLLYNSGLTNPASVATASPREVERILRNAVPFKSGRQAVDEKDFEAAERRAARCIWASGKKGLTEAEAAELIVMEAKHIVRAELGSMGIEWNPRDVNKKTVQLDCESGDQTGDLNKDGKRRMEGEDGAKTGRKDRADNNGEGSNNEMEMETNQSKPQEVKHRVINLGEECKEQMGSTSKKGVVVKGINDKSQRSKVGKDQQATQERVYLGKTSSGSNFPRKNSGLKVKGLSVVHQQSVLVESERNKPVQSKTKFVPYSKGAVKDAGAVKQICVEEKTCEKVDKEGGHVAVSRDVNKAEVRNQFNKNKSGSAEMKNRNGKTQLTDKVERKLTVDEDRNQDHDDREDGKRDGYVGNTRELRVQRPTRNNSNIQKEQKSTRGQGLPLTISGGNCGTTEHKGSVKGERYSNQFSRVNKVGQETMVKGGSRDEMETDEVGELVSEVGCSQERIQDEKPAVRLSESHSSGESPELFLGSPEESQIIDEAEEEEEDVCGMDASAREQENKVKNGSCPKEYSFLFSPIDSHLEDFLENYDSQQDIIAISASPELKFEKKSVERQVRTSFGIGKTNKHLSKPAIELNGGREPQTKDALIGHSLGQCKDRRKDLDPVNKVGKILNLGEASSKCSSHFTKNKRDNFNSASRPKDIVTEDLIPAGRENVEKCSISEPVLSDNFLEETSECLSPGTLAVLDFLVDGDGEEVTFTQVNSPTNSKSPDLFSEDPELQLKDPVLEGRVCRHSDDLGKSKLERQFYGKVDIEGKEHSKDRRLQWKCGNSVKVPQRGSPLSTAMQRDVDTCKADTPNRNVRKRKSDEKLPGKESGAIKRVSRCHSVNRSKVNSTSGTPSAPSLRSDSLPRTPSKGKTPLPFLNSGVMRSSSRRPCRRSQISSTAASSSSAKGKAMLSFNFETPTDVDIETVSSECDDLDVAMDSEDLDIELEPSQPEEPSHLANLATKSASSQEQSDKKFNSQMDEIDIDSDISLSEVEGNIHFQDDRQSKRRDFQKYTEATSTKRNKQLNDHEIGHLADNLQAGDISETHREKTSSAVRNEVNLSQTTDQPRSQLSILESPIAPSTPDTFAIIDVCANRDLFETFIREWKRKKRYAFSIGCECYEVPVEGGGIGGNHRRGKTLGPEVDGLPLGWNKLLVTGLAISWGAKDAYYISFQEKNVKVDLDASLSAPPNDESISVYKRIQEVASTLELSTVSKGSQRSTIHRVAFDVKEQLKILVQVFGCVFSGIIEDPKVAHWLLDPSAKEKNLHGMISQYLPTQAGILDNIGGGIGLSSLGISPQNPGSARLRACVESVLLLDLMESLKKGLSDNNLLDAFRKIEMPSIMTLTHVELNGFGFNPDECETQKVFMQSKLSALEEQAYLLAGRSFSLTSPEDIAQVLFMELKLPPNGDVVGFNQGKVTMPPRKTLGGRGRGRLPKQFSTSKESLEKIKHLHPLPGLISEWRKMSMSLTKVVFPLQKEKVFNEKLGMYRMFTVYQTHTATGRVATLDPNIQAIPKDFEISLPSVIGESPPHWSGPILGGPATATKGKARRESRRSSVQCKMTLKEPEGLKTAVSLRHAFCPFPGGLLLAADYSQLELRILAHLSQDVKLIRILNADGDVFRQIAAQWKNVEERDITDKQRQEAKQICYGMIYGIGAKALGEQLEIEEEDAACFMETFRDQYKGMKNFIKQTVDKCRERGFVETISKRRRYLPSINHSNLGARNHAERQAVNTTIQGSAADLVKTAMVQLQQQLSSSFPATRISHRHWDKGKIGLPKCRTRHSQNTRGSVRGAYLVLQLHDELIYEVHKDDLEKVATLVRKVMESAMRLLVKLPVKIKVGPTWGSLKEI